jgi:hypothetical protein
MKIRRRGATPEDTDQVLLASVMGVATRKCSKGNDRSMRRNWRQIDEKVCVGQLKWGIWRQGR